MQTLKSVGFFILCLAIIVLLVLAGEERPHRVSVGGKEYIRSKEYTGNGTYQVILVRVDSTDKNNLEYGTGSK